MPAPDIHIVPNFHYDVAYLKSHEGYLPECMRNIVEALRILDEAPNYRFLIEQVILLEIFWNRHPEHREALQRHARAGRLEVAPGMYVMPDMNHPDAESMYQQAKLGRDWLERHLGTTPRACWIADCWGHHAQLPQILRQCGYEHYVFWRCMRPEIMRNDFLWQGLDGTAIRTHWLAKGYGNIRFPSEERIVNAPDLDLAGCGPKQVLALIQEIGNYGGNQPILLCNGGDFMFPQATAPAVVERLAADDRLPPVRFSTPSEYLAAVNWDAASVVDGDFNSSLQGTFTSNIRIKQRNRQLVNRLLSLEAMAAVAGRPVDLGPAWRLLLKQQFHDIVCGTITDEALADSLREFDEAATLLDRHTADLAPSDGVPGFFNPLEFAQRVDLAQDGRHLQLAVPPLGFATLADAAEVPELAQPTLPCEFGNAHYCARIDANGYIVGLIERQSGAELVGKGPAPFGSLAMQLDYGDLWMIFEAPLNGGCMQSALTQNHPDPYDRGDVQALINRGTFRPHVRHARVLRASAEELVIEQTGSVGFWQLAIDFRTEIRFLGHSPRIEFRTEILPKGKHCRLRAAFPTAIPDGAVRHEIPCGIQGRTVGEHVAQNWLDYGNATAGLALLNRGTPGNAVDNGTLLLSLFRSAAMEYKAPSEASFAVGVPHTFEYAIVPHPAGHDAEIVRQGRAFNRPPVPVAVIPEWLRSSPWRLEPSSVALSGLRLTDHGVFVRIYEATGHPAEAVLSLPGEFTECAPADGLEQPAGPFQPCGGELRCQLAPLIQIRAFLLRRQGGRRTQ